MTIEEVEDLVKTLVEKRAKVEELKQPYRAAQEDCDKFEGKVILALAEMGKKSYQSEQFGTITRKVETRYSLPDTVEDRKAYFDYLREKGMFENMVTVNANTHNSFCKAEFEAVCGQNPEEAMFFKIPGIKEPSQREILSLTKPRGK